MKWSRICGASPGWSLTGWEFKQWLREVDEHRRLQKLYERYEGSPLARFKKTVWGHGQVKRLGEWVSTFREKLLFTLGCGEMKPGYDDPYEFNTAIIHNIYVLREHRGDGLQAELLSVLRTASDATGCSLMACMSPFEIKAPFKITTLYDAHRALKSEKAELVMKAGKKRQRQRFLNAGFKRYFDPNMRWGNPTKARNGSVLYLPASASDELKEHVNQHWV